MEEISANRAREIANLLPDFTTVWKFTPEEWEVGEQKEHTTSETQKGLIVSTMNGLAFSFSLRDGYPRKQLVIHYPDGRRWVVAVEKMP